MTGLYFSETYTDDSELFARLGLRPFVADGEHGPPWRDCGTVETDTASVRVEVSCMPAQFWRFTVEAKIEDVQGGVLQTGSGTLSDFWPTIELWASGMIGYREAMPV